MRNFCRTIFLLYRAIVKPLCYKKWDPIWRLLFVCSVISKHDFVSDFIVVVNSVPILADIMFINLRLLSLTY